MSMRNRRKKKNAEAETIVPTESEMEMSEMDFIIDSEVEHALGATSTTSQLVKSESKKKIALFLVRAQVAWLMIIAFLFVICMGRFYLGLVVMAVTVGMYVEVVRLKRNAETDKRLPWFFSLRWYWYFVSLFGFMHSYVLTFLEAVEAVYPQAAVLRPFLELMEIRFSIVIFSLLLIGLVLFITSLRRYSLKYQFSQLSITILTCLAIVVPCTFCIANLYEGLIWFFLGTTCVMCNDIWAYFFGITIGKTRLLRISPKKTLEGFLGASVVTPIWAVIVATIMARHRFCTCPSTAMELRPFYELSHMNCDRHPVFEWTTYTVAITTESILRLLGLEGLKWTQSLGDIGFSFSFTAMPVQFHAFIIAMFASFFAPLGGFFASGLKRAMRVKDFATIIPGHGGIVDRFDCQILMTIFVYLYIKNFVFRSSVGMSSVEALLKRIMRLSVEERVQLMEELLKVTPRLGSSAFG